VKRLLPLLALLVLAVPASASAATTYYVGKTEQGYRSSAKVVDGDLKWLKVTWRADCQDPGYRYGPVGTIWLDRPDGPIEQSGRKFTDSGSREVRTTKGHKGVIEETLTGRLYAGGVIKANHTVTARFFNSKGKQYDTCSGSFDVRLKKQ
jgi:hypothetical protein